MDQQAVTPQTELECMLQNENAEPKALPFSLLKHITNSFSDEKIIGTGGFAVVYKGMLGNGTVAVKKLSETLDIHEKKFSEEVGCLMMAKHKNIVRFLGYCSDTQGEMVKYDGKLVLADVRQRLLCFEYLPKGSLDKNITDASCGLEWTKRYQIITGICDGLYYLHQKRIVHLDLKPANILLDDNLMPKIADFGLSRCFDEKQTRAITSKLIGTMGYMAPELYAHRHITFQLDIYSLGMIIIEIITGEKGYADVDNVLDRWRNRLDKSQGDKQLEEVRVCIDIAIQCTDFNPVKRPDIKHIIGRLGATKMADESNSETGKITPAKRKSIYYGAAKTLADVHKVDVPAVGLQKYGIRDNYCKRQVTVPLSGPTIVLENTIANEVKKSVEELYNITNQDRSLNYVLDNSSNVQQCTDIRETASDVEEALIIGRTEEKQKTLATLSGSITPEFTVLPIYGIGGIGKTTLAQLVFNDSQFAGYTRLWVYVSQNLDLNKIGNSIISQLSKETHVVEKQMIHNKLRELLAGKKILIVLDDVWEKNPGTIKDLKAMLRLGVGSTVTIIVTTRDEAIAREICHTVEPYKLETLTDQICWEIIKQKTNFKDRVDKKQLKHIGRAIATRCGGVALAAQSLGYTLNGKTSDEWESVRDNYIWNVPCSEDPSSGNDEVLASLLLSYTHMPECLKLCFSYCAVFPKGHNIVKYDLIHQWIALGFTESSKIFNSMQLCEKYVTQLLGMSFLQYSKTSLSDGLGGKDVTLFTMHDLVHDLARVILDDQFSDKGSAGGERCRYALLTDCIKPVQLSLTSPTNIKALYFRDCGKLELRGDAFSLAMCLHVLDLSECLIQMLPDSVGQLKHLRYLHAPRIKARMTPDCITKLSELNYLNLRDSRNISALPDSIGDIKGLMHLDLSGSIGIRELPVSFAELKQLVYLDLSGCYMSIDVVGFTKLQHLNLSGRSNLYNNRRLLPEVIGNLTKLRYLNLSRCLVNRNLFKVPEGLSHDEINSLLGSITTLSNLEHLYLSQNYELSSIPESIGNLRKLHTLDLSHCFFLKKLPDSMVKMVSLKVLNVGRCDRLDQSTIPLFNFVSLPHFVVHASSETCSSNIILLNPTNPVELTVDRIENVNSAEEAQSIKLMEKQKIKELKFQWTVAARRFVDDEEVLEKLVPPSSVQILHIIGYENVSIPYWLMGISQYLPNLRQINLCDFPWCKNLPQLSKLPNLRWLDLCRMGSLEEWNTSYASGEEGRTELLFPKLYNLSIKECAKLRIKPCLPRAMFFSIVDCDNVLLTHISASSSSPITNLVVQKSKLPLCEWRLLHQLPALRSLTITSCSDLSLNQEELPRWSIKLKFLQELRLCGCRSMASLPRWLGELASLEKFMILCCDGVGSLPDSIQKLTKLDHLTIRGCPILKEWCESEENKMKLAHIRQKYIQ
ncbi:unnamed protein product [Alopecurus aequalis]